MTFGGFGNPTAFGAVSGVDSGIGRSSTIRYPHPFFDVGQTYLPISVKHLMRWCQLYYKQNGFVRSVVDKMAQYPVTDIQFKASSEEQENIAESIFKDQMNLEAFNIEMNIDYMCCGNAYCSIHYPIIKYLTCRACQTRGPAASVPYDFRNFEFIIRRCGQCGASGAAQVEDRMVRSKTQIRLIRWDPFYVDVIYNALSGMHLYTLGIPDIEAMQIRSGNPVYLNDTPQVFIEAVKRNHRILLSPYNIFHMKRPAGSGREMGTGEPLIMPVLKDLYLMQVLKKAQECVSPDTLIETTSGLVRADDVNVGSTVRTHTGAWQTIEKRWDREPRPDELGVEVTLTGLRHIPAIYSPHHPVLTVMRNDIHLRKDTNLWQRRSIIQKRPHLFEETVCPTDKLSKGAYVLYPSLLPEAEQTIDVTEFTDFVHTDSFVYSGMCVETAMAFETVEVGGWVEHNTSGKTAKRIIGDGRVPKRFPSKIKLTEDLAYILGWYAGDGAYGSRRLDFWLGPEDSHVELFDAFRREFGIEGTLRQSPHSRARIAVFSDVIVSKLVHGLVPGEARTKEVPIEILNGTLESKIAFLKGLWAADGCFDSTGRRASLMTASLQLSYGVYRLLLHVGCIPSTHKVPPKTTVGPKDRLINSSGAYPVNVTGPSRDRLLALFEGRPAREVTHGKSGYFWKDYFVSRVHSVRRVPVEKFIDFKVNTDATFCTAGTATKNCIAHEHLTPLRIIHPMATGNVDPLSTMDMSSWQSVMKSELLRWRQDPAYTPVVPTPIGFQFMGGQGKSLLLFQEIEQLAKHIVIGMNVPPSFVFGGMSFSSSSVDLRQLENLFLRNRTQLAKLNKFVVDSVMRFLGFNTIKVEMTSLRTADDVQRKQLLLQLAQVNKVSDATLLAEFNLDPVDEQSKIEQEMKTRSRTERKQFMDNAENQGRSQIVQARYQGRAQQEMMKESPQMAIGPDGQPAPGGGAAGGQQQISDEQLQQVAKQIAGMPKNQQAPALEQLKQQLDPQMFQSVVAYVQQLSSQQANGAAMKALPEQRPPRRGADKASV